MPPHPTNLAQSPGRRSALAALCLTLALSALAGEPATGLIVGRVLNATSGNYLNNARVMVDGTLVETFTNESGDFRLGPVTAGPVRLTAAFSGLGAQSVTLTVPNGGTVRHEFELSLDGGAPGQGVGVVLMDKFTVQASELTAQIGRAHV